MLPRLRIYVVKMRGNPPDTENSTGVEYFLKDCTI